MKHVKRKYDFAIIGLCLCVMIASIATYFLFNHAPALNSAPVPTPVPDYISGVRDDGEFDRPAADWSAAAGKLNKNGSALVDVVVARAGENLTVVPFPAANIAGVRSVSQVDLAEPYLSRFDADGTRVILTIQPQDADVAGLIDLLLARYGNHKCLAGINVDLDWKKTGTPQHANNAERDRWLGVIARYNPGLKLFLTGYNNYTYFPDDAPNLVVMYSGSYGKEGLLLTIYGQLAKHFASVGIYTGNPNSDPPTSSDERILGAAPNTRYIIHLDEQFSDKIVIFELDEVQAYWLENTSKALIDLHMIKGVPLTCGVMPYLIDALPASDPLPAYLKLLDENSRNIVEIAQQGYIRNGSGAYLGQGVDQQRALLASGLQALNTIGVRPDTFIPPYGQADDVTASAAKSLGFKNILSLGKKINSTELLVLSTWTPLATTTNNRTVLKSSRQLMDDIDNAPGYVVNVVYRIQDFDPQTGASIDAFGKLLDDLKKNPNYRFMTPRQYGEFRAGA